MRRAATTKSEVTIGLATEADRDQLHALIVGAVGDVLGRRGGDARLRHLGYSAETLPESLLAPVGPTVFVARSGGAICGLAALSRSEPRLEVVFVDVAHRRQGVGRALVAAVEAEVHERGGAPLSVVVAAGSRGEKSLFEALGYRAELLVMEPRQPPQT